MGHHLSLPNHLDPYRHGTGSGLDADLLDGINSTKFVYDRGTGNIVQGATVRAGGKQSITDATGFFRITNLAVNAQFTVIATKDDAINSTVYVTHAETPGNPNEVNIWLDLGEVPVVTGEQCTVEGDQDNDQFGATNFPPGLVDQCDSDCGTVGFTVQYTFFEFCLK